MSEPTFKTLPSAIAHIALLSASLSAKDGEIATVNGSLQSALTEKTKAETDLAKANSDLAAEKTRADLAESALNAAKGEHETIEARIEAEATLKAVDQVASAGGAPLALKDDANSGGAQPPSANNGGVNAANFWEQYRNQTPSSKGKFYATHKHLIGR